MQQEANLMHNIIMEGRKKLSVTGVTDIDSFNEQCIIAITSLGVLTIKGSELHIGKVNTETGDLTVDGQINSLVYTESISKKSGSTLKKIFR